jgi:tetratricopeptide (TPR) repeat protein
VAGLAVHKARSLRPELPEVQRATAEFAWRGANDIHAAVSILQGLAGRPDALIDDKIRLAEAALQSGSPVAARKIYEMLPSAERENPRAQKLLATILRAEGHGQEAMNVLRTALEQDVSNPESRLELAMLTLREEAFPEREKSSLDTIWKIASGGGKAGARALEFLASGVTLEGNQPKELRRLAAAHPALPARVHYAVLGACLRTSPSQTAALVEAEKMENSNKPASEWAPFLRWLASIGENAEIIKFLPRSYAMESRELFLIWADALLATGHHAYLAKTLSGGADTPVSQVIRGVLLAECAVKSRARQNEVTMRLETALEGAREDKRCAPYILRAARLAESCASWDLAAIGYARLAKINPAAALDMLEKTYEMNLRSRNERGMLDTALQMRDLQPENPKLQKRVSYLRLLLGIDMEKEWAATQADGSTPRPAADDELTNSLAFYRLGDREGAGSHARNFAEPLNLEPGQRAVAAGVLAWLGDASGGSAYLEQVPGLLLLPEEAAFARRAR